MGCGLQAVEWSAKDDIILMTIAVQIEINEVRASRNIVHDKDDNECHYINQ